MKGQQNNTNHSSNNQAKLQTQPAPAFHEAKTNNNDDINPSHAIIQQQSLISQLEGRLQHAHIQSAHKDQQIAALKHNIFEQAQQIGSLQRQVQGLEALVAKILKRNEWQKRLEEKGSYKGHGHQSSEHESRDRDMMLSLSGVSLAGSRKEETYLQSSRIGNLSNSRKSRREELMQCQSIKDVYNLPEYRHN